MKLVRVFSNKDSFRTVEFNSRGVSLIVGSRSQSERVGDASKRTYNGVGKSLLIRLLHFCLGSSPITQFEDKLPDWAFGLEFEHDDVTYTVMRYVNDQRNVVFQGETIPLKKYRDFLATLAFPQINEAPSGISFRSLIPRFARQGSAAYVSALRANPEERRAAATLLNNCYLLGLDVDLVQRKDKLSILKSEIEQTKRALNKDGLMKELLVGEVDIENEVLDLEERIRELEVAEKEFKVAHDYTAKKSQADKRAAQLRSVRRQRATEINQIASIGRSLEVPLGYDPDQVRAVYEEAGLQFPARVTKTLQDVNAFHQQLLEKRRERLTIELKRLQESIDELTKEEADLVREVDGLVRYLGSHGALDDYRALLRELEEKRSRLEKLNEFQNLSNRITKKTAERKEQLAAIVRMAQEYLEEGKEVIQKNKLKFREYSRQFYLDKPGGIDVRVNEGDNQTVFDVSVKIQDDASDGINEVKIFCFDLTLLTMGWNHRVHFLFHDSRLFADMDARQRAHALEVAWQVSREAGLQYIASINQDMLETTREWLPEDVWEGLNNESVVLRLTDESEKTRLLGIQVDLKFGED